MKHAVTYKLTIGVNQRKQLSIDFTLDQFGLTVFGHAGMKNVLLGFSRHEHNCEQEACRPIKLALVLAVL